MGDQPVIFQQTIAAPLANATAAIFSSVVAFPGKRMAQGTGLKRLVVNITHDQIIAGLKGYKSVNRGVTWLQVYDSGSIAIPAAGQSTTLDFLFEPFDDFKIDALNGAANQGAAAWSVSVSAVDEHSPAGAATALEFP